ncbi:MAG: hypothetical protein JW871_07410 [Endomicrobiales bacterium]|nr:hypothetical protein [Endomicrobiales bacterium]
MKDNRTMNQNTNNSLLRHPLVITFVSILLGTFGIWYLQNNYLEKKAVIDQRLEIAHSLVKYVANAQSIMRNAEQLHKLRIKDKLSDGQKFSLERDLQNSINMNYEYSSKVYLDFALYFSRAKSRVIYDKFKELETLHNEAMNIVISEDIKKTDYPSKFHKYYELLTNKAAEVIAEMREELPIPLTKNRTRLFKQ